MGPTHYAGLYSAYISRDDDWPERFYREPIPAPPTPFFKGGELGSGFQAF